MNALIEENEGMPFSSFILNGFLSVVLRLIWNLSGTRATLILSLENETPRITQKIFACDN